MKYKTIRIDSLNLYDNVGNATYIYDLKKM